MKTNPCNRWFVTLLTLRSRAKASLGLTTTIRFGAPFRLLTFSGVWLCLAAATTNAADLGQATNRFEMLARLKLEDVLNTEVTSVSKRPERLLESAAAIFVISGDDIRRSGARQFPEMLRMSPGMEVARINGNEWGVQPRGFNSRFANSLLVLIDGRTVYTTENNAVFWELQNTLLEDIDRIEVIRGPGGTLWGANAVNGVVNIITKDAQQTQGIYVTGGVGTEERGFGGARYGTKISENGFLRAYMTYDNRDNFKGGVDDFEQVQGGFRTDWHKEENHFTLQGDYYAAETGMRVTVPSFTPPYLPDKTFSKDFSGGNALFRFKHEFSDEADLQLQTFYDRFNLDYVSARGHLDTFDIEFQQRFPLPLRQNLMYGLGYRYLSDRLGEAELFRWSPDRLDWQIFSGFVQDEIGIVEDRLRLTLGSKLEHNDFTEWEVQPNARLAWLPSKHQTVWFAVSRAVQTPSRVIRTLQSRGPAAAEFNNPPPIVGGLPLFLAFGSQPIDESQKLVAYELGYRIQATDRHSFDLAAFYNQYDNLLVSGLSTFTPVFTPVPHLRLDSPLIAVGSGETYGFEISSRWQVSERWRLVGAYSYLKVELDEITRRQSLSSEGSDPRNQVSLQSSWDLPGNLELDIWGRFVDALPQLAFGSVRQSVKSYFDLDVRLGWKPIKNLEIALVGQNLVDAGHFEFGENPFVRTQVTPVPRGGYLQISFRY